jgi:hypothetical protein
MGWARATGARNTGCIGECRDDQGAFEARTSSGASQGMGGKARVLRTAGTARCYADLGDRRGPLQAGLR